MTESIISSILHAAKLNRIGLIYSCDVINHRETVFCPPFIACPSYRRPHWPSQRSQWRPCYFRAESIDQTTELGARQPTRQSNSHQALGLLTIQAKNIPEAGAKSSVEKGQRHIMANDCADIEGKVGKPGREKALLPSCSLASVGQR